MNIQKGELKETREV